MNSNRPNQTKCRDCGSTTVAWMQAKSGKWYLAEVRSSRTLSHEKPVVRGPHFKFCTAAGQADRDARNAAIQAARANEQATIEQLIADRAPIEQLVAAGASFNQIIESGATAADIAAHYNKEN